MRKLLFLKYCQYNNDYKDNSIKRFQVVNKETNYKKCKSNKNPVVSFAGLTYHSR